MKKSLLIAILVIIITLVCINFYTNSSVVVNGQELTGFSKILGGLWGSMIGGTALMLISFFAIFMLLGGGLLMMALIFGGGIIFFSFAFPFMLPLLIPLVIIWLIFDRLKNKKK
ncbi:MAG: hypothetical protein KA277_01930 [Fusobacteriaceae bacterium]|jgi:hypothetical protein|nr:hypothetical protein [Fusobacteriaceae bacterium]MBP6466766.1 hypothetical protein [Fusobacteriaceae bacterium]MBP9595621.1 hypothetical protein [Fusobacteriaceae bacterium]MBU9917090.1 hypothetical protein [Fusobacteriaceae bacterium]